MKSSVLRETRVTLVFCGETRNKLLHSSLAFNRRPTSDLWAMVSSAFRAPQPDPLPARHTSAHNVVMNKDRRLDGRARFAGTFANKYIDGIPHVVELLDVSASGLRVRRILEPESATLTYPLELSVGGVTLWAWTRRVWRRGNREALRIVGADAVDRARLRKLLRGTLAA